jgi:hypothetical protein
MATAAPHVKLLRQLASAKDDYLSGAFDISWDGAKATLYLVFGRPSHAVFDTDQAQIEGEAAIDALLAELPRTFVVSDWRRAMSPQETLSITIDELAGPFVRLAGSYADDPITEEAPEWWSAEDSSPDLAFGLADFPLMPGGRPLWAETSPENVNLAERLAELPPSIVILTGAKLRAAAVVSGGDLIDAVWIDDEDQARGEAAAMAILGATKGSLAGYALDDPRVAEALTMLWRLPLAVGGIEMAWLDPASMLAAFRADGLDRVLVIDAPVRGIALFSRGGLVAVYSETQRSAVASPERLRSLLSQAKGRLTVMARKPRPSAADRDDARPSATEFFAVIAPEAAPEDATAAETPPEDATAAEPVTDHEPASEPANLPWYQPASSSDSEAAASVASVPEAAGVAGDAVSAPDAADEAGAPAESTIAADAEPAQAIPEFATTASTGDVATESTAAVDPVSTGAPVDLAESDSGADGSLPPPPPPSDHDATSVAHDAPPPPPELPAEAEPKPRRRWRLFGGSRRKRSSTEAATAAATVAAEQAAHEAEEAASFAGWSVRQQSPDAQPVWARSKIEDDAPAAAEEESAPVAHDDADASTPVSTWSVVERDASTESEAAPVDAHAEFEVASTPEAAAESTADAASEHAHATDLAFEPAHDLDGATASEAGSDSDDQSGATAAATPGDEPEATASPESGDEPAATAATESGDEPAATAATESGDEPAATAATESGDEPAATAATEFGDEVAATAAAGPGGEIEAAADAATGHEVAHEFWADFATPDPDADVESAPAADAGETPVAEHDVSTDVDAGPVAGEEPEAGPAPAVDAEPVKRPSGRTVAPWSWPLAEAEVPVENAPSRGGSSPVPGEATPVATGARSETESEDSASGDAGAGDQAFFQRDEPVGSQFVDFDEVRNELVQIGVVWLGESNAVPVTALLLKTRSTIDDFVATIDTIRGLHVEGQDPASIQAMAREMHQQAAERLCGA